MKTYDQLTDDQKEVFNRLHENPDFLEMWDYEFKFLKVFNYYSDASLKDIFETIENFVSDFFSEEKFSFGRPPVSPIVYEDCVGWILSRLVIAAVVDQLILYNRTGQIGNMFLNTGFNLNQYDDNKFDSDVVDFYGTVHKNSQTANVASQRIKFRLLLPMYSNDLKALRTADDIMNCQYLRIELILTDGLHSVRYAETIKNMLENIPHVVNNLVNQLLDV